MYRIFTENKNVHNIIHFLKKEKINATIYHAIGIWQGTEEKSLVIELSAESSKPWVADYVARHIKAFNNQEVVLIQRIDATIEKTI